MSKQLSIQLATVKDAPLLAELGASTFREAYDSYFSPDNLNAHIAQHFQTLLINQELQQPTITYFITYLHHQAIGYAKLRTDRPHQLLAHQTPIELERIYIRKTFWRKGIGQILMQYCWQWAAQQAYSPIWLAVWKQNHAAQAFYKQLGFTIFGERAYGIGKHKTYDFLLRKG